MVPGQRQCSGIAVTLLVLWRFGLTRPQMQLFTSVALGAALVVTALLLVFRSRHRCLVRAHTRAKPAVLDLQRPGLCETRTLRWSKPDANSRSLWRGKLLPAEVKGPEADQGGLEKAHPFSLRDQWFESISLQRRVGCELGYCKGGPATSFRGRHKRVRDSNAAPHSDDVRTGSTAVDADGQSEHVSLATRPGHAGHQVETDISLLRSETTVKTRPRLAPTDWSAETAAGATSTW